MFPQQTHHRIPLVLVRSDEDIISPTLTWLQKILSIAIPLYTHVV